MVVQRRAEYYGQKKNRQSENKKAGNKERVYNAFFLYWEIFIWFLLFLLRF